MKLLLINPNFEGVVLTPSLGLGWRVVPTKYSKGIING